MLQLQSDQYNYCAYGMALIDRGFVVGRDINGLGLVTKGLVWQIYDIWGPAIYDGVSTSWSETQTAITTTWAETQTSITTTWTASSLGQYGEISP